MGLHMVLCTKTHLHFRRTLEKNIDIRHFINAVSRQALNPLRIFKAECFLYKSRVVSSTERNKKLAGNAHFSCYTTTISLYVLQYNSL